MSYDAILTSVVGSHLENTSHHLSWGTTRTRDKTSWIVPEKKTEVRKLDIIIWINELRFEN